MLSQSEPLWWEKIGKVANQVKLVVPTQSKLLWWKKIGKVANWVKLTVPSHSEPLQWEKVGKLVNQVKLAILSHSEPQQESQRAYGKDVSRVECHLRYIAPEPKCHADLKSNFFHF